MQIEITWLKNVFSDNFYFRRWHIHNEILLSRPKNNLFLKNIIAGDVKWVFYDDVQWIVKDVSPLHVISIFFDLIKNLWIFLVVSVVFLLFLNFHRITGRIGTFTWSISGDWEHKTNYDTHYFLTEIKMTAENIL